MKSLLLLLVMITAGETATHDLPDKNNLEISDAKSCSCPNSKLLWYLSQRYMAQANADDPNMRNVIPDVQNGESLDSFLFTSGGTMVCSTCQKKICSTHVFLNLVQSNPVQINASNINKCNALTLYDSRQFDSEVDCNVRSIISLKPIQDNYIPDFHVILPAASENGKCSAVTLFVPSHVEMYIANFTNRVILNETIILAPKQQMTLSINKTMDMFYANPCLRIHTTYRMVDVIFSNSTKYLHDTGRLVEVLFESVASEFHPFVMRTCEFWSFFQNAWSSNGCKIKHHSQSGLFSCQCFNSSSSEGFEVKARYKISESTTDKLHYYQSLVIYVPHIHYYLELVGYVASLYGLIAIGLTGMLFKTWRNELTNKILMHMSAALGLNLLVCMISDVIYRNAIDDNWCVLHGFFKQYSFLVRWFWMLVMGILQLRRIITISGTKNTPNILLKIAVFVWGAPFLLLSILLLWNPEEHCCCPDKTVAFWTITFPAGAIMVANLSIFVIIVCRIISCCGWGKMKALKRHGIGDAKVVWRGLRTLILLLFIFEVPWILGFVYEFTSFQTVSLVVFQYFLVTSHGFTMFIFFLACSERARSYWKNYSILIYSLVCASFVFMIIIMLSSITHYLYHFT